jgi:hypothetical protein
MAGMMSSPLQVMTGLKALGHDVVLVEKAGWANSCFNPLAGSMSDDGSYGAMVVQQTLSRFGLGDSWCFVDLDGNYHGQSRDQVRTLLRNADLFLDFGSHGTWNDEASQIPRRVLLDGEPGWTQMRMALQGQAPPGEAAYTHYLTVGQLIGLASSHVPTGSVRWQHFFHPVDLEVFPWRQPYRDGRWTTIMNWQAHSVLEFEGVAYGQKDWEFARFIDLPSRVAADLEMAIAGDVPLDRLDAHGWRTVSAHEATLDWDRYAGFIQRSRGEWSVAKHVFISTHTGWFGERSAAYLASGRPVILQDTGFSEVLPTGEGLFAFSTMDEAVGAIEAVESDYERHCRAAREIAEEYFDARKVLAKLLDDVLGSR